MNEEARAETFYLVTFYVKMKLLCNVRDVRSKNRTKLTHNADGISLPRCSEGDEAVRFVQTYGSYLNLHLALVAADNFYAKDVMRALLDSVAKHNPCHRDGIKIFLSSDSGSIISYKLSLLSCLLVHLP